MNKKITAILLIVCMMVSILPVFTVSADASPFYKVIAEDTMDYKAYNLEPDTVFQHVTNWNFGTGWSDYWTVTGGGGGTKFDVSGIFTGRPNATSNPRIKRTLAEVLDFSKEGIYTFTFELRGTIETQIAVMELGNSGIKFGAVAKDAATGVFYPQLQIPGGTMEICETSTVKGLAYEKSIINVLTVTVGDGADTLELVSYCEGTTTPVATLTKTAELAGKKVEFISAGYDYNSYSKQNGVSRVHAVKVEYDNPNAMTIINKAKDASATKADIDEAFNLLANYLGDDKADLIADVKANAAANNINIKPVIVSATPDFTNSVKADDFGDTITVVYSYPLENAGKLYIKNGETVIAESTAIERNKVTLEKKAEFDVDTPYVLVANGVKDFKGDLLEDYSFRTAVDTSVNPDAFSKLYAEDTLDKATYGYTADTTWNTPGVKLNGGSGWDGDWSTTAGLTATKFDVNGVFVGRPSAAAPSVRITRNLKDIIDFSKEGIYTFTLEIRDGTVETQSAVMELGESGIKFGSVLNDTNNKYHYPQLMLPGETTFDIYSTGSSVQTGMGNMNSMFTVLEINVSASGADTLKVKTYAGGSAVPEAMITKTAELSGKTVSYIAAGYDLTTYSKINGVSRIRSLKAEFSNPLGQATVEAGLNENATEEEVKKALAALMTYTGRNQQQLINTVKAIAEAKGYDVRPQLTSANPDFVTNKAIEAHLIENTITLNYSYPLAGTGKVYIKQGDDIIAQSTKIDGSTVNLMRLGEFKPGKIYTVTSEDVVDFKGDLVKDFEFSTYVIPTINVKDGAVYDIEKTVSWEVSEGMTVTAKLQSFAEQIIINPFENNTKLTVPGNYKLTITASLTGLPTKSTVYNFTILPDEAPVANDVKIELAEGSTAVETGATLKGSFAFSDANAADELKEAYYTWYKMVNGSRVKIGEGETYTLTEADDNHNIVLGVVPVSTSTINPVGEEAYSAQFKGAYAPTATTVTVDASELALGSSLKAEIDYSDINADDKAGVHIVKWYEFGTEGDKEITANVSSDGYLTVTKDLVGKYLYAIVTPVSSKAPYYGTPVTSGEIYIELATGNSGSEEVEKSDFEPFSGMLAKDDVNEYPIIKAGDMTDNRGKFPVMPYDDKSKGFAMNWSTSLTKYTPPASTSSNCFQDSAAYGGWGLCWAGPNNLYKTLVQPIDMSQKGTYTFVTEAFDYSGASLTGTDFRMYIGSEDWYYGYTAPNSVYIPHIKAPDGKVIKGTTVPVSGKAVYIKAQVDVRDGVDTFKVKMWDTVAAEPEEWNATTTGEMGKLNATYIAFTPNPGSSNSQRYISFEASYENVALKDKIGEIAGKSDATPEEIHDALAKLSTYPEGEEKEILLTTIKNKATDVDTITTKLVETSVSTTDKNISSEIETINFKYDFVIGDDSEFVIKEKESGAVVAAEATINENKISLDVTGDLEPGKTYVIDTSAVVDYKGDDVPGFEFVTFDIPEINVADGKVYSQYKTLEWQGDATVTITTPAGETSEIESGYSLDEIGEYTISLVAGDSREITFKVEADRAPEAKNVSVRGFRETGKAITGSYEYYDKNGDAEENTVIQWYRVSGSNEPVAIEGANALTYTLTVADENCDIIFGVTPSSNSAYNPTGKEVRSTAYVGAYAPVAKDLKVAVDGENENLLYASYTYYDKNGDAEVAPVIKWYLENGTEITENVVDGKLAITSDLYEKTVYVTVKPKSNKAPVSGAMVTSAKYLMPSKPVVSNVVITGTAKLGNMLTADYVFVDPNNDVQGATTFEWKNVSTGEVIGTNRTLEVKKNLAGVTVTVTVKGVSEKIPYDSEPVTSAAFEIPSSISSNLGGGSGSGGNFTTGGSMSGSPKPEAPVAPSTPTEPTTPTTPEKVVFADTNGHWGETYIKSLLEKGVVVEDTNFRPNDSISRAELLAMLFRSAKTELSTYGESFGDVSSDDWFAGYVQTALDMGIVSGADAFRPNDAITREETAKIVANMLKLATDKDAEYADKGNVSDWAVGFVNAVVDAGIFKGDADGNFNPKGALTRAETATVIYRLLEADSFNAGGAQ